MITMHKDEAIEYIQRRMRRLLKRKELIGKTNLPSRERNQARLDAWNEALDLVVDITEV